MGLLIFEKVKMSLHHLEEEKAKIIPCKIRDKTRTPIYHSYPECGLAQSSKVRERAIADRGGEVRILL